MKTKITYQAVELGHWALAARLAYVPDLDATLAPGVDVTCRVADGDSAHHFPVAQCVDLASVAWDAWAYQCIWWEGHGLHLSVCAHMKGIGSAEDRRMERSVAPSSKVHVISSTDTGKSKTHGFPPEMDVRLDGKPGALM